MSDHPLFMLLRHTPLIAKDQLSSCMVWLSTYYLHVIYHLVSIYHLSICVPTYCYLSIHHLSVHLVIIYLSTIYLLLIIYYVFIMLLSSLFIYRYLYILLYLQSIYQASSIHLFIIDLSPYNWFKTYQLSVHISIHQSNYHWSIIYLSSVY